MEKWPLAEPRCLERVLDLSETFFLPKERLGKLKAVGWWGRLDISGRFSRELDAICRLAIIETLQLQIAIAFATRVVSARAQPTVNHTHVATPYRTTSVRCRFRLQAPVVELSSLARALWRVTALELYYDGFLRHAMQQ